MRSWVVVLFSVVVLAGSAFGQDSPSAPTSTPAAPVSLPIDLQPDAAGAVPPERMREFLLRAEEKDLENDKRQRDYTYIERQEEQKLDVHGEVKKT